MARQIERLTRSVVDEVAERGMYPDGDGLYLQVRSAGARSWIYRFMLNGRRRDMGLGPARLVSLSEARQRAHGCRRSVKLDRSDPVEVRRSRASTRPSAPLFRTAARLYIEAQEPSWKTAKHALQWRSTLARYAHPVLGEVAVDSIRTEDVLKVLEPIWLKKPETAGRVRMRVQAVLDWAGARGLRSGDNPARWEGHLDKILPRRSQVAAVKHHPALPFAELPQFMGDLGRIDATVARALQWVILTGVRTSEALGARWGEIDLTHGIWTIPAQRMKAAKEHRVPLSPQALALLVGPRPPIPAALVFQGAKAGRPLSNMAMLMMLRRLGRRDLTVHGFRSSFRDWVAERTDFPSEVAEMALAHTIANKVEAAYRRGDLFDKRRQLMNAWGDFCGPGAPPIQG